MCDVGIVGEVEEIAIRSELDFRSAAVVSFDHAGEDDEVSHADDTGGADSTCVKGWCFWKSVLGEDELLCYSLVEMLVARMGKASMLYYVPLYVCNTQAAEHP